MEISDYAHYAVLLSQLLNESLTTLTALFFFTDYTHYAVILLNGNLWLRSLRCFSSLTTLTTLFYFTTTNPRDHTSLTTLLLSLIHQIVFLQEFKCFHITCMCNSNFTVRNFSGVLHALLPQFACKLPASSCWNTLQKAARKKYKLSE